MDDAAGKGEVRRADFYNAWHRANPSLPAVARALDWLAARQGANGWWGGETNRVKLTSMACLAFLARRESPASDRYGKVMEQGLQAIVDEAGRSVPRSGAEEALLIAYLSDVCAATRIPTILVVLRKRSQYLLSGEVTAWHVDAAKRLFLSRADPAWTETEMRLIAAKFSPRPDRLLDQAALLLLVFSTDTVGDVVARREAVNKLDPSEWFRQENPMQTAYMLANTGVKQWWLRRSWPVDIVERQIVLDGVGWWTPATLDVIADTREVAGMTEEEAAIYTTACMVMALSPRSAPLDSPIFPERGNEDSGDIQVELRD